MNFQTKNLVSFSVGTSLLILQPIAKTFADTLNTSETAPTANNGQRRNIFNIKPKNDITITGLAANTAYDIYCATNDAPKELSKPHIFNLYY